MKREMTAPVMTTRDPTMIEASIAAQERQATERIFDEIINARIRLGYSLKLADADVAAHCRFFDLTLIDTLAAIANGIVIGHPTPRQLPKLPVYLSQVYRERFKSCSEEMVMTLGEEFRENVEGK